MYDVARSVVLTSRRPVPDKAGNFQRGEGVTIILLTGLEDWRISMEGIEL